MLETIVGKRGRGKTSLTAEILASKKWDRVFIFDYLGEYQPFSEFNRIFVSNTGFKNFMQTLWKLSREGIETLVILDEISLYGKYNFQIEHLYRLGRHKQIQVIATSQRFYSLPVICRSQTDIFHMFQITEPRDVQYLSRLVSPVVLDTIQKLGQFEYINISLSD